MNPNLTDDVDELRGQASECLVYISDWGVDDLPDSEDGWGELSEEAAALASVAKRLEELAHERDQ